MLESLLPSSLSTPSPFLSCSGEISNRYDTRLGIGTDFDPIHAESGRAHERRLVVENVVDGLLDTLRGHREHVNFADAGALAGRQLSSSCASASSCS